MNTSTFVSRELFSKQVAVRSGSGEGQHQNIIFNPVNQKPVRLNVALPMPDPIPRQRAESAGCRLLRASGVCDLQAYRPRRRGQSLSAPVHETGLMSDLSYKTANMTQKPPSSHLRRRWFLWFQEPYAILRIEMVITLRRLLRPAHQRYDQRS